MGGVRGEGPARKANAMRRRTECTWMSGPRDQTSKVPAAQWWLAISRGRFVSDSRRQGWVRPLARCHMTPKFVSPLRTR